MTINQKGKSLQTYRLSQLDLNSVNALLRKIHEDISEALAIGQNPDLKGQNIRNLGKSKKPSDAVTKAEIDSHSHKLADLTEKDYASLTGRPGDDDFINLRQKATLREVDSLAAFDAASRKYKRIDADLVIPPKPATTVVDEIEFEQASAVGTVKDFFAREDHTHGTPTIDRLSNRLAADVAMTIPNTDYDGPTVRLTEGRWLVVGTVTVASDTAAAHSVTAKLWDGKLTYASSEERTEIVAAAKVCCSMSLSAIINVVAASAPLAVKITCFGTGTAAAIKAAAVNNGAGNNASMLNAIRIGPSV